MLWYSVCCLLWRWMWMHCISDLASPVTLQYLSWLPCSSMSVSYMGSSCCSDANYGSQGICYSYYIHCCRYTRFEINITILQYDYFLLCVLMLSAGHVMPLWREWGDLQWALAVNLRFACSRLDWDVGGCDHCFPAYYESIKSPLLTSTYVGHTLTWIPQCIAG